MFAPNRVARFAATAAGVGLAALAGAGTAGAFSSPDDEFLANIADEGISYDSAGTAVSNAHYVCGAIDDGAIPHVAPANLLSPPGPRRDMFHLTAQCSEGTGICRTRCSSSESG